MSIVDIAKRRMLSPGTILDHIEKVKGLKQLVSEEILYLKKSMTQEDFNLIFSEFKKSKDGKMKPIYEKFKGKYSFEELKVVRLFI